MDKRVQLAVRNAVCEDCKMAELVQGKRVCVTAQGPMAYKAKILIVTKFVLSEKARVTLVLQLAELGFKEEELAFTGAIKCSSYEGDPTKTDFKACQKYLDKEIDFIKPKYVIAFGNEALTSTTGHSGIMKYRGRLLHHPRFSRVKVMATVAPAAVIRNPSQVLNFKADLQFFYNEINGISVSQDRPKKFKLVATKERLQELLFHLKDVKTAAAAFDIESSGFNEKDPEAFIVSLAITTISTDALSRYRRSQTLSDDDMICWVIPLHHRASRWSQNWQKVLKLIIKALQHVPKRIAHNGKFDCRWLYEFSDGVDATFDTMIAAHLLNENRSKGLKPLARILLGASEWDISISTSKKSQPWYEQTPLKNILKYNGLDTWHTMRLYLIFSQQLKEQPRLLRLFTGLMMPASRDFVHIERHGVWTDKAKLLEGAAETQKSLRRIDKQLMQYVPEEYPAKEINFGPSNFLRWWLFEHLKLPITKRGKPKDDGSPGNPSVAEDVLSHLAPHHPVIPLLLERVRWRKYETAFFAPYLDQLTSESRIHTTFKLTGTVTGRLSSGKADLDKVTGAKQTRGVNLQQVPRDKLVRGCFGAPPGWTFIEADYSQIELRLAAFLANESTMLMLYASGQDIHMAMAMKMTGKPASEVTAEERKKAKAVNFGFLYGMGWAKFIETAWNNYGVEVNETDAQSARRTFFDQFPMLIPWHARQRRLAHKYQRVESPLGRVRHLPDITSRDKNVVAEAERQAINSPVQAMASDLTLLSMTMVNRKFKKLGLKTIPIGTVHDAINFEAPNEELPVVLPIIKDTMENLPLEKLFRLQLTVPTIADLKVGTHWGGARELSPKEIYNYDLSRIPEEAAR